MGAHAGPLAALAAVLPEIGANIENGHYLDSDMFETLCEYFRTRGQSGLINTRHYIYGGAKAYHRPGIVGYAAHNIHDHPDHQALAGMAEVSACINGIFLRTRHNDYALRAPVAGGTYLQTAELPLPPVPPSVLALPTVQEQVEEMRQYFLAFANADVELRDYEPYFRFSLSYLEVWAEVLSDTIGDTFNSDRHQINVNNLYAAIAKHTMYSVSGHQDRPENTPHIPFIVRFTDNNGRPKWALIRYRICAVDVGDLASYAPGSILVYRDQFALRHATGLSADQLFRDRRCRFELAQSSGYQFAPTLLDELMAKVPGLNGGGTLAETFNDTGTPYNTKQFGSNANDLNAAYYNRMFSVFFTASGRSNVRRGWNDPMLFVAATTRQEVAPVLDPTMSNAERRYSYAIPLELILRTPLEAWNPHGVPLQSTITGDGLSAATAWSGWKQAAYNYRVPQAFYTGGTVGDPADTGGNARWVLDSGGQAVQCRASGLYVLLPPIQGITNPIRLRYPIAPCYDEGSYEWGYQQALQEELSAMFGSPNPFNSGGPVVTPGAGAGLVFDAPLVASIVPRRGNLPTFTRATTATVVDHEGIIRYCKSGEARFQGARRVENLCKRSFDFANPSYWNVAAALITDNAYPDPWGTNTAGLHTTDGLTNRYVTPATAHAIPVTAGRTYRLSAYIKKVSAAALSAADVRFAIYSNFTTDERQIGALLTAQWQRFSLIATATSSNANFTGMGIAQYGVNGTQIAIAGWQLEDVTGQANQNPGEYVSAGVLAAPFHGANVDGVRYFETLNANTVAGNSVVTEAAGSAISSSTLRGFLSEGLRTNLCLRSEEFNDAAWTATNVTVTANVAIAPDGRSTADRIDDGTLNLAHQIAPTANISFTSGVGYAFSIYAKYEGRQWVQLLIGSVAFGTDSYANFDIQNGVLGDVATGCTAKIVPAGNGWYRISLARAATATGSTVPVFGHISSGTAARGAGFTGTNATTLIWGAQLEAATSGNTVSFATSYIPTAGSTVQRNADSCFYTIQDVGAEGAAMLETSFSNPGGESVMNISDGTLNNRIGFTTNTVPTPRWQYAAGGVASADIGYGPTLALDGTLYKYAGTWKVNSFSSATAGTLSTEDTSGGVASAPITRLDLCDRPGSGFPKFGTSRNVRIWKRAVARSALQAMTA